LTSSKDWRKRSSSTAPAWPLEAPELPAEKIKFFLMEYENLVEKAIQVQWKPLNVIPLGQR
jgi:hypothetical protein